MEDERSGHRCLATHKECVRIPSRSGCRVPAYWRSRPAVSGLIARGRSGLAFGSLTAASQSDELLIPVLWFKDYADLPEYASWLSLEFL